MHVSKEQKSNEELHVIIIEQTRMSQCFAGFQRTLLASVLLCAVSVGRLSYLLNIISRRCQLRASSR